MKKTILILLFFTQFGFTSRAQEYIPVIQDGSFWEVTIHGPNACFFKNHYRLGNDFSYNGVLYKKVEVAPVWEVGGNPNAGCLSGSDFYINENEFEEVPNISIREDSTEQRVYVLYGNDQDGYQEFTMADFTLEVGDVMTNAFALDINDPDGDPGGDLMVVQIDILSDGRRKFYMEDGFESFEEGVGNFQGPAYMYRPYVLYEDVHSTSCYGNDTTDNSACAPVLSTDDYTLSQIQIFPNPTSDKLSFTNLENNSFKLYSILGKEMSFQFSRSTQEIDISHLQSGVYFLEIRGRNLSKRIVKILKN